jgi:hypothetical protein
MGSDLEEEALIIHPILTHCLSLYNDNQLSPSDFVGIFILSYLGMRRPKGWSNGKLKASISSSLCGKDDIVSVSLSKIPGLLEILDRAYVMKRFGGKSKGQNYLEAGIFFTYIHICIYIYIYIYICIYTYV